MSCKSCKCKATSVVKYWNYTETATVKNMSPFVNELWVYDEYLRTHSGTWQVLE